MITWLKSLFAWELKHSTGIWHYYENSVTGKRKVVADGLRYGHQPINNQWLNGKEWEIPQIAILPTVSNVRSPQKCKHCGK